jgi:hypothetical protein
MEDRSLGSDAPLRPRTQLKAIIASLFASLLLLFGGDVFGRSHPGLFSAGAMSRSDTQQVAGGRSETRFLAASEQSGRQKLRPWASGDGCLKPDVLELWMCRHGDHSQPARPVDIASDAPRPYWSRAPPSVPHPV